MWEPLNIEIKNISSHQHTFYDFITNKIVPIYGKNLDRDVDGVSNGSGKSSFSDAIGIAFTGSPLRKIINSEIVRNGEKFGEVTLKLDNAFLNSTLYIYWKIYSSSKSSECIIKLNGEEQTQLVDINAKKKFIFDTLGINKEDFYNLYVIGKDYYTSFTKASDTEKKNLISRFSGADVLDDTEELITKDTLLINKELESINLSKSSINGKIEVYKEQLITNNEDDFKITKAKIIDDLSSQKAEIENQISVNLITINQYNDELSSIQEKINEIKTDEFDEKIIELEVNEKDIKVRIKDLRDKFNNAENIFYKDQLASCESLTKETNDKILEINKEVQEINKILSDIENSLQSSIECPKCTHKFSTKDKDWNFDESKENLEEGKTVLEDLVKSLSELQETLTSLTKEKKSFLELVEKEKIQINSDIEKIKKELTVNNESLVSWNDLKNNATDSLQKLQLSIKEKNNKKEYLLKQNKTNEERIIEITETIEKENIRVFIDNSTEINEKINKLENKLIEFDEKYLEKELERSSKEIWIDYFKRFKSFLANKSISSITGYCNMYLKKMKYPYVVSIEGYRQLANKKMKENIDIQILRDGITPESFAKFSGGEKALVDISLILSGQKLNNLNSLTGGLNLLFLDEITESLDSPNLSFVLDALENIPQTILIITHTSIDKERKNKLVFEKFNKITKIV